MQNSIDYFLSQENAAGRVMSHARQLLILNQHFQSVAPGSMRHGARVANFKNGTVIVHAQNGAIASKLRQMGQRLCLELTKSGIECTGMEVKVQPNQPDRPVAPKIVKPLSPKAQEILRSTANHMKNSALGMALEKLLASGGTNRQ